MDPHRKLLVLATNELLKRGLISLDGGGVDRSDDRGHLLTEIAGERSALQWNDVGFEELRITVWWKYDHEKHPQREALGTSREEFCTPLPLAKMVHFPKFIGAAASGWLERKAGKYLQGYGQRGIFDKYTRRGELVYLNALANPIPIGFAAEGQVHM